MTGQFAEEETRARLGRILVPMAMISAIVPIAVVAILAAALLSVGPGALPEKKRRGFPITRIYAANGTQIAALNAFETFIPVPPDDIPPVLEDAVLAIEDRRFYAHRGVDFRSVLRAMWTNLKHHRVVQGGSTITQQYVKQAYMGDRNRTLKNKLREAVLARRVERRLSKDEILHRYLSTVYFGGGAYGVGAAADNYFRKPVSELTLGEAALLAGVIRAPTALDPRSNRRGAESRRRVVLDRMFEQHRIDEKQYRTALDQRVVLVADGDDAPATLVHPPRDSRGEYRYFVDYVSRYLVARYGEAKVFEGGLRVDTSLDPQLQALAESAVDDALAGTAPPLEMSLVSLDPGTGLVRALVGGRDFDRSQVNLALGGCVGVEREDHGAPCMDGGGTGRQSGSLFKVFALARALEEGMSLRTVYPAPARYTFPSCRGSGCTVENGGRGGYGRLSLRRATAYSVNTVFAQLIQDVGVKKTAALAHRLGVTAVASDGKLPSGAPYGPSLALGAAEVSPLDMAASYGVFANRGIRLPASPVMKVTGADGEVLEDNTARRGRRVLPAVVADKVTEALRDVVEYGTGTAADIQLHAAAGKTGTAENYSDAWFVGFTPTLSTAVWMGYADSQRPLKDVSDHATVYGGSIPARTWGTFMKPALQSAEKA